MNILEKTLDANKQILDWRLNILTWGNVSICSKDRNAVCIKPSGIDLAEAVPEDMSLVDMSGTHMSGGKPSVDTDTHLEIYKSFDCANAVVHTHSKYATIFAQAAKGIPCLGTTHADYFYGEVPCVQNPTAKQIAAGYELYTGRCIVDHFLLNKISPRHMQAALVRSHGAFCWGDTVESALENALVLETIAEMAYGTMILGDVSSVSENVLDKHFFRKNGENKYYGQ